MIDLENSPDKTTTAACLRRKRPEYNAIALGDLTQRMEIAELFIGLLKELQEVILQVRALLQAVLLGLKLGC